MYGSRTAEAISATDIMNQIRLAELFATIIAEHAGIVAASAIYSFGRVSGEGPSSWCSWHSWLCEHSSPSKRGRWHSPMTGIPAGDGLPPSHYNIWMSALCQSLTTLVADFVSMATDWKYHSLDYFTDWVTDMRKFIIYILIIVTLGASRSAVHAVGSQPQSVDCPCALPAPVVVHCRLCVELLMLFCPTETKEHGMLLFYCDRPTLFGRIGKSAA